MLAELEVYHSRPIAPTRRVAIGRAILPVDDSPGFGGLLLGAIVAKYSQMIDAELLEELEILSYQVEQGHRIPQPRLRHRLQRTPPRTQIVTHGVRPLSQLCRRTQHITSDLHVRISLFPMSGSHTWQKPPSGRAARTSLMEPRSPQAQNSRLCR